MTEAELQLSPRLSQDHLLKRGPHRRSQRIEEVSELISKATLVHFLFLKGSLQARRYGHTLVRRRRVLRGWLCRAVVFYAICFRGGLMGTSKSSL
jgi:hypothetical protein